MSIASEISRILGAKDEIRAAIRAKGVELPASVKLDAYDTYIASIPQGAVLTPTAGDMC